MSEAQAASNDGEAALAKMVKEISGSVLDWLVSNAPIMVVIFDTDGVCRLIKGRALEAAGHDISDTVGQFVGDLAPGDPEVVAHFERCVAGETSCFQVKLSDRIFDVCCEPLKDENGQIAGVVGVGTDVTEKLQATAALAAEEELLKATIEAVRDAVIATDSSMRIVLFNGAAEKLTGWSRDSARGKRIDEVVSFEQGDRTGEAVDVSSLAKSSIEREVPVDAGTQLRLKRNDGSTIEVAAQYAPIKTGEGAAVGSVLSIRDISEERRRDEERIRLEKLESLALMASGLTHDFNNMLAAILANLALAKEKKPPGAVLEFLDEAEIAANQARDLTNRLASYARPAPQEPKPIDLSKVITQATAFALAGKDVEVEIHVAENLWKVLGDENQLLQAFNNLLINAEQAMPNGGCVTVRAENLVVTEGEPSAGPYLGGGRFVKVIVEDQGMGILPEHLEKVFDPYFTTKPAGTGLGLSTTYSIVTKHGGHMSISSTPGEGTVVLVYLPAADDPEPSTSSRDPSEGQAFPVKRRALVMDDEVGVRKVAKLALEGAGWEVDSAEDAIHAIEKFRAALEQRRPYDVVVLDSTMRTGLDGSQTLAELRKLDPSVRAVAFSGHIDDSTAESFRKKGFAQVLAKPFSLDDLRAAVVRAIGDDEG
jgi:two-component system cell cycle sensor histidine kinase/response regulator CckA